jgi:carbamate kinase
MRVVIALGGNALIRRGEQMTIENQRHNVKRAAAAIGRVIEAGHQVIVTHGNGPQVGLMALQDEAYDKALASPLDVLGAETVGMIGYLIEQELGNVLADEAEFAVILTQIEVDPADPAFLKPTKPIGPVYSKREAETLSASKGWIVVEDGSHFRRAVASPRPKRILEANVIRLLVEHHVTVICAGGGGVPVICGADGNYSGVEAIIDKDHASRLLANDLQADALLMLTDIDGVYLGWGTAQRKRLQQVSPAELKDHVFSEGSMRPKVEAAAEFVSSGGGFAGIGRLEDALEILNHLAGTIIET